METLTRLDGSVTLSFIFPHFITENLVKKCPFHFVAQSFLSASQLSRRMSVRQKISSFPLFLLTRINAFLQYVETLFPN